MKTLHPGRRAFLVRVAKGGGAALLATMSGPASAFVVGVPGSSLRGSLSTAERTGPVRLETATADDFERLLGERFRLRPEQGRTVTVTLAEVTRLPSRGGPPGLREPFSLVFDAPATLERSHGRYRVTHERLGTLELFMVPVDLPAEHNHLQATFG